MIDKEIRSASWKFGLVALVVLVTLTQIPYTYGEITRSYDPSFDSVDAAMSELSVVYMFFGTGGMVVLAGLLGAGLVSSEVGGGTIFALLSRPVSRRRLFLTKYAVCATFLFAAAVLGAVAIFFVAFLRGYPLGEVSWSGLALAVVLMWLASLFSLGVAILVSTLTRNVMASLIGTAAAVLLVLAFPVIIILVAETFFWNELGFGDGTGMMDRFYGVAYALTLYAYWPDAEYFSPGGNLYATIPAWSAGVSKVADFVVCFFAAIVPLAASLWLFERKKF